jgi:hypothetical protein
MTPDYRAGFEACLELLLKHDEIGSMFCQGTAHDIAEEIRIEGGLCTATEFMELKERKMDELVQMMDKESKLYPPPENFGNWCARHTLTKG